MLENLANSTKDELENLAIAFNLQDHHKYHLIVFIKTRFTPGFPNK